MNKLLKSYQIISHVKRAPYLVPEIYHCGRSFTTTSYLCSDSSRVNNETDLVTCDFSHQNKIAVVTFNAPSKLNALSVAMGCAFKETIENLSTKYDLRAVILTGKGTLYLYGGK